jgi:hypothetical protein
MSDLNSCPKCGGPLPIDGALGGGCPRCMLELGFETTVGSRERPDRALPPSDLRLLAGIEFSG